MHDSITVGLPLLAILFGILWNQQGLRDLRAEIKDVRGEIKDVRGEIKDLRSEMNSRFNYTDSRIDRMQADLSQFYVVLGEHSKAIEVLEKKG